ncbi:uncharacterized protein LOC124114659 [Haliotis rufescens]|uniref:uncharacterized protein LOC124114659 n=1 Tax=Haliotis rufescens TaxID=6454 RepID=UPI00201F0C6A|nr:uncharacterized protein LOC124114659 [Haliotis rufescens]
MFIVLLVAGILYTAPEIAGLQRVKCFKDECVRGVQYCVEERQRCYSCDDVKQHCGTEDMPLQCDAFCKEMAALEREGMQNETIREIIKNYTTESQSDKRTIEMLQHDVTTTNQSLQDAKRSLQLLQAKNNDLRNTIAARNNTVRTLSDDVSQLEERNEALKTDLTNMSYLQTNYTLMAERQSDLEAQLQDQKIATAVLLVILGVIVIVLCITIYRCQFHKGGHADTAPEKMSLVSDTDTKTSMNIEEEVKADVSLRDQERQDNVSDDSAVFAGSSSESVNMQGGPQDHAHDDSHVRAKNHHAPRSVSPDSSDDRRNGFNQDTRGINPTPDDVSVEIRLAIDKEFSTAYKQAAIPDNEIWAQVA